MDPEIESRFEAAKEIAAQAGKLAHSFWLDREKLSVEAKGGAQDLVSEADSAVERLIRDAVSARFPGDGFLGEELGLEKGRSAYTWVIDPIDGTSPFLFGMLNWCVAISVVEGHRTVIAATDVPTHAEQFSAVRDGGAWLNARPLHLPEDLTVRSGLVGIGASYRSDPSETGGQIERLMAAGGMYFRNGSGALMLAYVAAGRLAGYYEPIMHPWDSLGGLLLVQEAGGRTAPFRNEHDPEALDRVLAAAPGAWDELAALFGD